MFGLNHPERDYTVRVYSKMDLEILDPRRENIIVNYDGSMPSGFTNSTYGP